jgi:hypothetical protein
LLSSIISVRQPLGQFLNLDNTNVSENRFHCWVSSSVFYAREVDRILFAMAYSISHIIALISIPDSLWGVCRVAKPSLKIRYLRLHQDGPEWTGGGKLRIVAEARAYARVTGVQNAR